MALPDVRRRAGVAVRLLASPRDFWLLVRMAAWAPLLPLLKFALPLPRLVRLLAPQPRARPRDREAERRVTRLSRLLYRSRGIGVRDNCLERSLVTFRYLSLASARPELVVGMRKDEDNFVGHVWVLLDGEPVHDAPESLRELVPVMAFDASGG